MLSYNVELGHGMKKMNENNQAILNEGTQEFFPRGMRLKIS